MATTPQSPAKVVHSSKFGFNGLHAPPGAGYYVVNISDRQIERGPFPTRRQAVRALARLEYVRGFAILGSPSEQAARDAAIEAALSREGMRLSTRTVIEVQPCERGSRRMMRVFALSPQGVVLVGVIVLVDEEGVRAELSPELTEQYGQEYERDRQESAAAWVKPGTRGPCG